MCRSRWLSSFKAIRRSWVLRPGTSKQRAIGNKVKRVAYSTILCDSGADGFIPSWRRCFFMRIDPVQSLSVDAEAAAKHQAAGHTEDAGDPIAHQESLLSQSWNSVILFMVSMCHMDIPIRRVKSGVCLHTRGCTKGSSCCQL